MQQVIVNLVEVNCGQCDLTFGMPENFYNRVKRDRETWYCPAGHPRVFVEKSDKQKLKEAKAEAVRAHARADATRALLRHEERSHAATRGHVTRKKKELSRVKAGVCPVCNRTFQSLQRHMHGQHPDFTP